MRGVGGGLKRTNCYNTKQNKIKEWSSEPGRSPGRILG
jgi:hypothetical protein